MRALIAWLLFLAPAPAQDEALEKQALEILRNRCVACHSGPSPASQLTLTTRAAARKGGVRSGPAVIPGNPDDSPLILFLNGVEKPRMPMGADDPLPSATIDILRRWIASLPRE